MVEPLRFDDSGAHAYGDTRRPSDELSEVAVSRAGSVLEGLLQDSRQRRFDEVESDFLAHLAMKSVERRLTFFEAAAGRHPRVPPSRSGEVTEEQNATMTVVEQAPGGPKRLFVDPEDRMVRWHRDPTPLNRHAAETRERIRKPVLANAGTHRGFPRMGSLFNIAPSCGAAHGGPPVPLEDVTDRANKVYEAMKSAGITVEEKMRDAEAITKMSKLPKNFVLQALQELQSKGYARRKAREKAAGYYLIK